MADLTQQQLEDSEYVEGLATDEEPLFLDLSDERQYRYALAAHERAGLTPENRPGLFKGLAVAREEHAENGPTGSVEVEEGWESRGLVTDVGLVPRTREVNANGFTGFVNGAEVIHSWLSVTTPNGAEVLAEGTESDFGNGTYLPVNADPVSGKVATPNMTATLTYSYKLRGSGWNVVRVSKNIRFVGTIDPVVVEPKKEGTLPAAKYIQIAIGRGNAAEKKDCDYWLAFNQNELAYYVPLTGNVEFELEPIAVGDMVLNSNVFIFARLARLTAAKEPKGGSKDLPIAEVQRLLKTFEVSGKTLKWRAPAPPKGRTNPNEHGETLNWGVWTEGNTGELVFLIIQMLVKLKAPAGEEKFGVANIESSFAEDKNPTDGTTLIEPLRFVWSCLAEGTPILMADGSRKPVELVDAGEMVRAGDGSDRKVVSTTLSEHRGTLLKLTAGYTELLVSRNHVVAKEDGSQAFAEDLEVGDTLRSVDGPVELTGVEEVEHDGRIGNLSLSEPGAAVDPGANSMFAGEGAGIEVGDFELQTDWEFRRSATKEAVLANLEPDLRQDYLNHLEEQAAVN